MTGKEMVKLGVMRGCDATAENARHEDVVLDEYPKRDACSVEALTTSRISMRALAGECYPLGSYTAPAQYLVDEPHPGVLRKKLKS